VSLFAAALLVAGCRGSAGVRADPGGALPTAPAPSAVGARADAVTDAILNPGDVVRVRIAYEAELSGDFLVNETGVATFPMLGAIPVVGRSAGALRADLTTRYARYLRTPAVEVTPLRRVTVLGAVRNPGLYTVDLTTSVGEALALAGGVSGEGNPDAVELVRDGRRRATSVARGSRLGESDIRSGDQLYVRERSWISRNAAVAASVISGLVTLAIVLLAR
jgi:polysaccharide export outer membrane protein